MALYKNSKTDNYVVAFRGTSSLTDFLVDVEMGLTIYLDSYIGSQFIQAGVILSEWINDFPLSSGNTTIVGHSLGGSLAQYFGANTGFETLAYNPYGVGEKFEGGSHTNISNYITMHDPVSSIIGSKMLGTTYMLQDESLFALAGHGIANFTSTDNWVRGYSIIDSPHDVDVMYLGHTELDERRIYAQINGSKDDVIFGSEIDNTLIGGGGKDTLYGLDGADTLEGGDDNDFLYGGTGNDTLNGGAGTDYLQGDTGDDSLHGGADEDTLMGGEGNDQLFGDSGKDVLVAGEGADVLVGGADSDTLLGQAGDDVLVGGYSLDDLYSEKTYDYLAGGSGFDTYLVSHQDVINDADYSGLIMFNNKSLSGTKTQVEGSDTLYEDANFLYALNGSNMTVIEKTTQEYIAQKEEV